MRDISRWRYSFGFPFTCNKCLFRLLFASLSAYSCVISSPAREKTRTRGPYSSLRSFVLVLKLANAPAFSAVIPAECKKI